MIPYFRIILNNFRYKFIFRLIVVTTLFILILYISTSSRTYADNTEYPDQSKYDYLFANASLKYVQLVTGRFDYKNWALPGLGLEAFQKCKEKRCFAIRPFYAQYPLAKSDGIIVHAPNLYYMPNRNEYKRDKKQIWMFYSMESPRGSYCSMHYKPHELDDWFNLTATYKQDSNFITDYKPGFLKWSDLKRNPSYINEYRKHKKNLTKVLIKKSEKASTKASVVWLVSHCETSSRRELYVNEMLKHIRIDIFGKCDGYFPDVKPIPCPNDNFTDCFAKLMNKYKFYLAFENSLCDDYITEKYWKFYTNTMMFKTNILPVVKGAKRSQYELVTNMSSLIFAEDFESPKALADHLKLLDSNSDAYLSYFKWKLELYADLNRIKKEEIFEDDHFPLHSYVDAPLCYMCSMLHNETFMNSDSNPSWKISEWFSVKHSCRDYDEERKLMFWFAQFAGFCF